LTTGVDNTGINCNNYSALLIGWRSNLTGNTSRTLGAAGLKYGSNAKVSRTELIAKGWKIEGDIETLVPCGAVPTEELSNFNIKVYPNPVSDKLHIETDLAQPVSIYNSLGVKISTLNLKEGTNDLEFDHSSGLYILEFNNSRKRIKVIKL
jgi:hypothetical protein